jgi:menaquinone-specific isochorismate synthase
VNGNKQLQEQKSSRNIMNNKVQDIISRFQNFAKEGCLLQLNFDEFALFMARNPSGEMGPIYFSPFFSQPDRDQFRFNQILILTREEILFCLRKWADFEDFSELNDPEYGPEFGGDWQSRIVDYPTQFCWKIDPDTQFQESFETIQNLITGQKIEKAVPIVIERSCWIPKTIGKKARLLLNLIKNSPKNLKVYAFYQEDKGIIGATPEVLFERKGQALTTMALAGTYPKFQGADPDYLLKSEKDLAEHLYVVKNITEKLSRLGKVSQTQPYIVELPTMWHLKTDIQVVLKKEVQNAELMNLLHPTAALGLYSKTLPWQHLKDIPHQRDRYWFGAPLGVTLSPEHFLCLVCIRNFEWDTHESRISSGCGIVKESNLELEWRELKTKRDSVKKLLEL